MGLGYVVDVTALFSFIPSTCVKQAWVWLFAVWFSISLKFAQRAIVQSKISCSQSNRTWIQSHLFQIFSSIRVKSDEAKLRTCQSRIVQCQRTQTEIRSRLRHAACCNNLNLEQKSWYSSRLLHWNQLVDPTVQGSDLSCPFYFNDAILLQAVTI